MSDWRSRLSSAKEQREQQKISSAMSEENLLSRTGRMYDSFHKDDEGYTSLSKKWEDIYKRAVDYYNNESHRSFYDTYSGTRNKTGYVADTGEWYNNLETLKTQNNADAEKLLSELEQYSRYYNADAVKYVRDLITKRKSSYDDMMTDAKKFSDHWGQWGTRQDYDNAVWENNFYSSIQAGDFDAAQTYLNGMYKDVSNLGGEDPAYIEQRTSKLKEYQDYFTQMKEYTAFMEKYSPFIDKYSNASIEDLTVAKESLAAELGKAVNSQSSGADPLGLSKSDTQKIERELEYVNLLIDQQVRSHPAFKFIDLYNKVTGKVDDFVKKSTGISIDSKQMVSDISEIVSDVKKLNELPEYFQGSALFEDGWQAGDVLKTAGATAADLGVNLVKGGFNAVEGLVDLGAYGVAAAVDASGDEEIADAIRRAATQSQTDYIWGGVSDLVNPYSVFSDQSDEMAQSLAQMYTIGLTAGAAGLGTVGTTVLNSLGMGLSTMGGSMGEAYQGGADDWEALAYGAMSGAIEAGSEMIFGGLGKAVNALGYSKGISSLDDTFAKKLSDKISSQFWKNAVQFGVKAGAEGLEEVIAGLGSAVAKKLTYLSEEDLWKLVVDERLLEAFVSGAVMSGFAQSGLIPGTKQGSFIDTTRQGRDFITGLTADGQRFVDTEYAARLSEAEKNGQKLSRRDKLRTYEDVLKSITVDESVQKQFAAQNDTKRQQVTADIEKKISSEISDKQARAKMAETLTKIIYGEHVSNSDLRKISQSKKALKVLEEITGTKHKAGEVTVKELRKEISSKQDSATRLSSENILATASAFFNMDEVGERSLMVSYATDLRNSEDGKIAEPEVYAAAYNRVYSAGKKGTDVSKITGNVSSILSDSAIVQAYRAGQNAAGYKNSQQGLQNGSQSGTISTDNMEVQDEQELHLRDSGERNDSKNSRGQVSAVEGNAGQNKGRQEGRTGSRDSEASSLSYDREVSAKSLVKGGLESSKVRMVANGSETESMKEARKIAESRGLKVVFFGGGNLKVLEGSKIISARAYIQGDTVYVRVDHSGFAADQLMKHEAAHDMIDKGEINVEDVKKLIGERFTPEEIDAVINSYAIAYEGAGMTADEIWEEVICDSVAEMNSFEGTDFTAAAEMAADFLPDLKEAVLESKKESRGPPAEAKQKFDNPIDAKESGEVSDAHFSIEFAEDIAENQRAYVDRGNAAISAEELDKAIADTAKMVEAMKPYSKILPQDKVGKTLVKNGSYDMSVENTTICIRTLAYNSFVDMVSEKVGRPLTQMESFLVSQKLYDIAKEPQCLYCYVSLDRKAFNEMVIRYVEQRDAAIAAYKKAGEPNIPSTFNAEWPLFKSFLEGRKPTKNMWDRYTGWIKAYKNGDRLVTLSDISTEAKRLKLVEDGGKVSAQVADILKYAQSASWAKKQTKYVAYYDEILKLKPGVIKNLNSHYGMRWYSFSDYSGAFIVENMQQVTDAAIRGLKGLSYTKDTDYAEIFAPTGMNINISVYAKKGENGYVIDPKQSADIDKAIKLRKQYPNVGIVVVATDKAGVEWALAQEWSDVVIPFHTVRTGADVADFYKWEIFNTEQSDVVSDDNLWDAYVKGTGKKKVSKNIYPSEHQNDRETYLRLCAERGLTPRFNSFINNPNYMKLVNETRQSEAQTQPLKPDFNVDAAERSFDKFVDKGGYYEGWYNDGVDVDGEADIVAADVVAGKKANEVDYGRQDVSYEDIQKTRKKNREHGHASIDLGLTDNKRYQKNGIITAELTDAERANILKNKKIAAPIYKGEADEAISVNKKDLESKRLGLVKSALVKIAAEFEAFTDYDIKDVDVKITLSKSNLKESISKDASPIQLAKLLPLLKNSVENAVGIESHKNRYYYDTDTVYFDNLLGAYIDGEKLVPVRFGLKHSQKGTTTLYVVVDQNKISLEYLGETKNDRDRKDATPDSTGESSLLSSVTYSIPQIIPFVNSKDLLRYIPNEMLDQAQRSAKWEAIAETIAKTNEKNDRKYTEFIARGDLRSAQQMVKAAAKNAGYTEEVFHGMTGRYNIYKAGNGQYGAGVYFTYDKDVARDYGSTVDHLFVKVGKIANYDDAYKALGKTDSQTLNEFAQSLGFPSFDEMIEDWDNDPTDVASNPELIDLLKDRGFEGFVDEGNAGFVLWDFDGIAYRIKSADPVTYDDNGNVIPLSERFNSENADIRFSLDLNEMMEETESKPETRELSSREILANMLESVAETDRDKSILNRYKDHLSKIENNRAEIERLKEERKKAEKAKQKKAISQKIEKLQGEIDYSEKRLITLEDTTTLKYLVSKERKARQAEAHLAGQMAQGRRDAEILRHANEKLAEQKTAYGEKLAEQKKSAREALEEQAKRYQESRAKSVEGRRKTDMKHKIQRVVAELDTLLRKGNKKSNVKLGLQDAVAAALEAFDINAEKVARYNRDMARLDEKIAAATDPIEIEALQALRDKKQRNSEVLADKLAAMKKSYEDIHNNADGENYPSYYRDEAKIIMDRISDVITKVGDTPISEMSLAQLQSVYDMYRMVLTTVRDANTAFIDGKLEDLTENAVAMENDLKKIKKLPEERLRAGDNARGFVWNELTPYYAFKRIGSQTLMRYYDELVRGQDVYARDLDEAKQFAEDARKKYKSNKWNRNEIKTFRDKDGRTFRLNLEQMMSIYAYSKREQALDHMEKGGFFFNNKETFRTKGGVLEFVASNESGYKVNSAVLAKIAATLTSEQRAYVDEMQAYLTAMGEKGNEVSRQMWGIDIFKEKVYFPLKSKEDFIYQANTPAETSSLKNDGMTKETKPHASNPIVLESFDDVWANHVEKMSKYHGFVIPIDNLNKIINYGSWIDGEAQSISTMLEARYSSAVNDYLTTFIKDLNGAKAQNGGLLGWLSNGLTKFKKTAVAASLSVVVQQPTAILRAASEIDPKYFAHLPKMETLNKKWEKIKKYAPVAIIKDIGGFDAGSGKQITEWLNADTRQGVDKAMSKIDDLTMYGAALGDQIGWGSIWTAVEREVQAKQNLKYGTEEFYEACGKRFTDVIVKTQVYDSTLSRSGFMRGKDGLLKMATAFMGEPTLSINMLADTFLQAKRGTIKKRQAIRTVAAVYTATIAASIFKSIIYALRDDDEDESYAEKYLQALGGTVLNDVVNPFNMLPIFRDVFSILDGWEVERTDMAIVQDLYNATIGLSSENKTTWRKIEDFAGALGALAGVPAKNLLRTAREMYNAINDTFDGIEGGDLGGAFVEGITGKEKSKSQTLYEALIGGESERIAAIRKNYTSDKEYNEAIRKALRDYDPRIKKAAQALYEGDLITRNEIMLEIMKEGVFDKETLDRAIDAEMQAIKNAEKDSSEEEKESEWTSVYSPSDIPSAFDYCSDQLALEIIAELTDIKVEDKVEAAKAKADAQGKKFDEAEAREEAEEEVRTTLRSSLTKHYKPLYYSAYRKGDSKEMERIRNILITSELYVYKTKKDVDDVLEEWIESYDED